MKNGNLPVFNGSRYVDSGLTKRELIAAIAMGGFMSSFARSSTGPSPDYTAKRAVEYADALLKELENQ